MQMCMKSQAASSLESELMNQGFPLPLPCKDTAVKRYEWSVVLFPKCT